jgi:hypothetical protein
MSTRILILVFLGSVFTGAWASLDPGLALVEKPVPKPIRLCLDNDDCAADQYCLKALGECDGRGHCVDRLDDLVQCLAVWDPVCGCDGQTYSNGCYAAKAAVSIDHPGECVEACFDNADCPPDEYCVTPLGECDGPGECIDRLDDLVQCLAVWDPVCGCDGQTYSNGCYAAKAAVSIDYPGECVEGCFENEDCPADEYCNKPIGDCDGAGECAPVPDLCQDVWMPVCGCDGVTYSNGCYAHRVAVNVAYEGECPGGCFDNDDCAADEYCLTPPAACDGPGECVPRLGDEIQCLDVWDPVCGCDGQTYSNGCYAAKACVSVDYEGACWY